MPPAGGPSVPARPTTAPDPADAGFDEKSLDALYTQKKAAVKDNRKTIESRISQGEAAVDTMAVDQGNYVRDKLRIELNKALADSQIAPEDHAKELAALEAVKAADLAQFHDDMQSLTRTDLNTQRMAGLDAPAVRAAEAEALANSTPKVVQRNVANWVRPEIPTTAEPAPENVADPLPDNTAEQLKTSLEQNQLAGAPEAPRDNLTAASKGRYSTAEPLDEPIDPFPENSEADAIQDQLEGGGMKYQAADAPTSESPEVIAESLRLAADSAAGKPAAFIPNGSPAVPIPAGLVVLTHPKGKFVYNPAKLTAEQAQAAVAGDQIDGRALGMSQAVKPTNPTGEVVVTDVNGQPAVMTELVNGPEAAQKAAQAQQAAAPGSTQRMTTAEDVVRGRKSLLRRGFEFSETGNPILMPNGQRASGSFDPRTGKIQVSRPSVQPTTYQHEGIHGEIQDMLMSRNPRLVDFTIKMLEIAGGEEPIAEGGAEASIARGKENALARLFRDNWSYLKTTGFGKRLGANATPEDAARLIAERFDTQAPGKVQGVGEAGTPGAKFQPIGDDTGMTTGSVYKKADEVVPGLGKRLLAANNTEDVKVYGPLFNRALSDLGSADVPIVKSAVAKMNAAFESGTPAAFTPEEQVVFDRIDKLMKDSAAVANANGSSIKPQDYYFPHLSDSKLARAYEEDPVAFMNRYLPEFLDYNQNVYGPARAGFDAKDAEATFKDYWKGVAKAPDSLGADFGALNKAARQYGLPPSMRETDPLRAIERYGRRFSREIANRIELKNDPIAGEALGYKTVPGANGGQTTSVVSDADAVRDAKAAREGVLWGQSRTRVNQAIREAAGGFQRLAYANVMQTKTGIMNHVQSLKDLGMRMAKPEDIATVFDAINQAATDWDVQYGKAIDANIVRPGKDPTLAVEGMALETELGKNLYALADKERNLFGGAWLENAARVRDYTIGELNAKLNLARAAAGDADSQKWLARYGAGADTDQPQEEQVARIANNFVKAMQGAYDASDLPAAALRGGFGSLAFRIQRFGYSNMMRVYDTAIKPGIEEGNWGPALIYVLGAAASAPVVMAINKLLTGRPSGMPTKKEVEAAKGNVAYEMALNVGEMAQLTGAFGSAGTALGTVVANKRGHPQALVGDPALTYGVNLIGNVAAAAQAMADKEPPVAVLMEAVRRTTIEQMQMLRNLDTDRGLELDKRNKRVFQYLSGRNQVSLPKAVLGSMIGTTFQPPKEISPNTEAFKAGELSRTDAGLTTAEASRAKNYPGGYASADDEAKYTKWMREAHGPAAVEEYRARKRAAKARPTTAGTN
jgi:hypothetical protein